MDYEVLKTEIMGSDYDTLREAQDYQGIANALNLAPSIDNQMPQPDIPKRLTLSGIFAVVAQAAPTDVVKLGDIAGWIVDRTEEAIKANDRLQMTNYLAICSGKLSVASKTALQSLLAETEPDPNWSATIAGQSRAQVLGLGTVSAVDIQKVLN